MRSLSFERLGEEAPHKLGRRCCSLRPGSELTNETPEFQFLSIGKFFSVAVTRNAIIGFGFELRFCTVR
jgi:hypothetical protein